MSSICINWEMAPSAPDAEATIWAESRCLYAYIDRETEEILYIGKCESTTVAERWDAEDKDVTFRRMADAGKALAHIVVCVGRIKLPEGRRMSRELLEDLESLLIFEEKPIGNIQNVQSRTTARQGRQGLRVACTGHWPGSETYIDPGPTA